MHLPAGTRAGLANRGHVCPKSWAERFPLARLIHCCPNLFPFLLPDQHFYIVKNMFYIYRHTSDCVETVYELPLLPNNTGSETFLRKSGAIRNVEWIFIIGVPA